MSKTQNPTEGMTGDAQPVQEDCPPATRVQTAPPKKNSGDRVPIATKTKIDEAGQSRLTLAPHQVAHR